jgi:hypothetical protein
MHVGTEGALQSLLVSNTERTQARTARTNDADVEGSWVWRHAPGWQGRALLQYIAYIHILPARPGGLGSPVGKSITAMDYVHSRSGLGPRSDTYETARGRWM